MKTCSKCGGPIDHNSSSSWCKSCKREKARKDRLAKGQKPIKRYNDPDGLKTCRKCDKQLSLDNFYPADPKHSIKAVSAFCKTCISLSTNKEAARAATARYRQRHRARYLLAHRVAQAKRKGLTVNGNVTSEQAKELYSKTHCRYCKKFIEPSDRTVDHLIPLVKGGQHEISNLDMACWSCNCSKRDKTEDEFLALMRLKDVFFGQSGC